MAKKKSQKVFTPDPVAEQQQSAKEDEAHKLLHAFTPSKIIGSLRNLRGQVSLIDEKIRKLQEFKPEHIASALRKLNGKTLQHWKAIKALEGFKSTHITAPLEKLSRVVGVNHMWLRANSALWSETAVLKLNTDAFEVKASDLNAAAAGTFKQYFALSVESAQGDRAIFLQSLTPTFTPAEAVADVDVSAPTITGTPVLADGAVDVEVVLNTDAGATKTYVATDAVSVACDLTIRGVALAQVTATWTVV